MIIAPADIKFLTGALSPLPAHLRQAGAGTDFVFHTHRSDVLQCVMTYPVLLSTLFFSFKSLQVLSGRVLMVANAKQSYDLTIECKIEVNQS